MSKPKPPCSICAAERLYTVREHEPPAFAQQIIGLCGEHYRVYLRLADAHEIPGLKEDMIAAIKGAL